MVQGKKVLCSVLTTKDCDFSQNKNKLRKMKTTTTTSKPRSTEFRFGSRSGVCSTHATVTDENMLDIFKKPLKEAR